MRSGQYSIFLEAAEYAGAGQLSFDGRQGQGHDGKYKVGLQLTGTGSSGAGIVDVLMHPHVVNDSLPEHYALSMKGEVQDQAFNLIGIGPLGVIVSLSGQWVSESSD